MAWYLLLARSTVAMAIARLTILIFLVAVISTARCHFSAVPGQVWRQQGIQSRFIKRTALRDSSHAAARIHRALLIRGGGTDLKEDDSDEGSDDEADDSEPEHADEDELTVADFSENAVVNVITREIQNTPPITRLFVISSAALTLYSWLFNNNIWPRILNMDWRAVLYGFQLWRIITPFLSFGPLSLHFALNLHYLWSYMSLMEKLYAKNPADFVMMLGFGMVGLISLYTSLSVSYRNLGPALGMFLSYIFGRKHEGQDTNVLGLFQVRVELVPWIFLVMAMVMEQEFPLLDLAGIALGHLYFVMHRSGKLVAPEFIGSLMEVPFFQKEYAKLKAQLG